MKRILATLIQICVVLFGISTVKAEDISVVTWNVENWGTSDPANIAVQLRDHFDNVDIFGLVEINRDSDFVLYADYAARDEAGKYLAVAGTTGNNIKLGLFFREDKFKLMDSYELTYLQYGSGGRAPLVGHFQSKSSNDEFLVVVNHFHRGNEKKRLKQSKGLRDWTSQQTLPVINVGDFNFDYDIDSGEGNIAYDEFIKDDINIWLTPDEIVTTNWSDTRPEDGENDYNSVLDFIFISGEKITGESKILVRDNDFPDDDYNSDHRAIVAVVNLNGDATTTALDSLTPLRAPSRDREMALFAAVPRSIAPSTATSFFEKSGQIKAKLEAQSLEIPNLAFPTKPTIKQGASFGGNPMVQVVDPFKTLPEWCTQALFAPGKIPPECGGIEPDKVIDFGDILKGAGIICTSSGCRIPKACLVDGCPRNPDDIFIRKGDDFFSVPQELMQFRN